MSFIVHDWAQVAERDVTGCRVGSTVDQGSQLITSLFISTARHQKSKKERRYLQGCVMLLFSAFLSLHRSGALRHLVRAQLVKIRRETGKS